MNDLKKRTKEFALMVVRFYITLPKTTEAQVLGKQMLRSGTSVGAHYREADHACSDAEFTSKLEGGLQELGETEYWLELLEEAEIVPSDQVKGIKQEVCELTAILITCINNVKKRKRENGKE